MLLVVALFIGLPIVVLAPAQLATWLPPSSLFALGALSSLRGLSAQLSLHYLRRRFPSEHCDHLHRIRFSRWYQRRKIPCKQPWLNCITISWSVAWRRELVATECHARQRNYRRSRKALLISFRLSFKRSPKHLQHTAKRHAGAKRAKPCLMPEEENATQMHRLYTTIEYV